MFIMIFISHKHNWTLTLIEPLYRAIQKDGLNFVSLYFKIKTSDTDSLFAQIGDSNDECSSSLEVECWNEDETDAAQQSPTQV